MQDKYVDMQDNYVNLQYNYVAMQDICKQIKMIYNLKKTNIDHM